METITLLQHYWWLIISLLGALLVFLLFVQGGQGLLYDIGKTEEERNMLVNSLGRKWEFTFTTLVTFGGAFFASFPLFYSTSFGGAFYVWMAILLVFVIQAVAYEYRRKPGNVFGEKTFNVFLMINGIAGPLLLGTAVGTLFTGANFTVDRLNLANGAGSGGRDGDSRCVRQLRDCRSARCFGRGSSDGTVCGRGVRCAGGRRGFGGFRSRRSPGTGDRRNASGAGAGRPDGVAFGPPLCRAGGFQH